jgi:hypothetical protein
MVVVQILGARLPAKKIKKNFKNLREKKGFKKDS